jgi:hypothetical protein
MTRAPAMACVTVLMLLAPAVVVAQPSPAAAEADSAELAKKLSNPISDLVSLPFQLNWEEGVGPNHRTRFILNVQPGTPFSLNQDGNMIARTSPASACMQTA